VAVSCISAIPMVRLLASLDDPTLCSKDLARKGNLLAIKGLLAIVPRVSPLDRLLVGARSFASAYPMNRREQFHPEGCLEAVDKPLHSIEASLRVGM